MRKQVLVFILLLVFTGLQGIAQRREQTKSLLWRISGKGLTKPSFLFGTIHLICKSDYLWTDKMQQSLAASEKVCFELDMDDNTMLAAVAIGFRDTTGKQLKDYFTAEQYQALKKFVKDSMQMSIALFQNMKPVMLQSMMQMSVADCKDPISYETNIMKTAASDHKEILGLEDPSEQISALESMPDEAVIKELLDGITGFTQSKREYKLMVEAYKRQDLPALYETITGKAGLGVHIGVFLDDRNKRWIARMTPKMERNSIFFAVGAGHLWGNNGVINLLLQAGYTVEPVL